jgi:hypothetical protein
MNNRKDILQDYLFHYNIYTEYWNCFKREDKEGYFNGTLKEEDVLKHKDITTLLNGLIKLK